MGRQLFLFISCLVLLGLRKPAKQVYLFTSFREPATSGLYFLYSEDGYHWKDLGCSFLMPQTGSQKIMRDPSMILGPDGTFHLVWTTGWRGDQGFGYASSKDLQHWSDQQSIDVMKDEPTTVNVWAPELFYDGEKKDFIIIWASTIPLRFPRGIEEENNNHRMYMTRTADFKHFSPAKLFFDPGFSVIDAVIVQQRKDRFVLVLKDNTRPNRNLKVAFAPHAEGPYTNVSKPITDTLTEGPAVVKLGREWLIYYDAYGRKKFGAASTSDFVRFTDVSDKTTVPEGHKHGTIIPVPEATLDTLIKYAEQKKK